MATTHGPNVPATSVPNTDIERARLALLSVDHHAVDALDVPGPLGPALAATDVRLHLALANCDVTLADAATAATNESTVPARAVVDDYRDACRNATLAADVGLAGAQLIVDLDSERIVRTIGYTCTPTLTARDVVARLRDRFAIHLISGDTAPILNAVAEFLGIGSDAVHAYQSPADKATTIRTLRADDRRVAMVGDYVNDRYAFAAADFAVFVDDGSVSTNARTDLLERADATIPNLDRLPSVLTTRFLT